MIARAHISLDRTTAVLRFVPTGMSELDVPIMLGDFPITRGPHRLSTWRIGMAQPDVDLPVIIRRLVEGGYRVIPDEVVSDVIKALDPRALKPVQR